MLVAFSQPSSRTLTSVGLKGPWGDGLDGGSSTSWWFISLSIAPYLDKILC